MYPPGRKGTGGTESVISIKQGHQRHFLPFTFAGGLAFTGGSE